MVASLDLCGIQKQTSMKLTIHNTSTGPVAELCSDLVLQNTDDFLDMIGNANYLNTNKMIIHHHNLPKDFFDLQNGKAGEVLQKFSTYQQRLTIIGEFECIERNSLKDFIRESNRIGRIQFVRNLEEALS